jgi:hypothetical protein
MDGNLWETLVVGTFIGSMSLSIPVGMTEQEPR